MLYIFIGDGKTHYIKSQLKQIDEHVVIAVNEAFTPVRAISKLCSLSLKNPGCAIYFNFTMLPTEVCD